MRSTLALAAALSATAAAAPARAQLAADVGVVSDASAGTEATPADTAPAADAADAGVVAASAPVVVVQAPPLDAAALFGASDTVTAARMERTLAYYARLEGTQRAITGVASLGGAAALISFGGLFVGVSPSGPDPASVVLMAVGAGFALGGIIGLLVPSSIEQVRRDYTRALRAGVAPREAVEQAEANWQRHANVARGWRYVRASIGFTGTALAATAVVLTVAETLSPPERRALVATVAGGAAVAFGALGVLALAVESEIEAQLRVWRLSQGRASNVALRPLMPTVMVLRGGAGLVFGARF